MLRYTVMSSADNAGTFKELEYASNPLSNKSSDHQASANESIANQTPDQTANQSKIIKSAELIYMLNWTIRDEIIVELNRYTRLLCGDKAEAELNKEKLFNEDMQLY